MASGEQGSPSYWLPWGPVHGAWLRGPASSSCVLSVAGSVGAGGHRSPAVQQGAWRLEARDGEGTVSLFTPPCMGPTSTWVGNRCLFLLSDAGKAAPGVYLPVAGTVLGQGARVAGR